MAGKVPPYAVQVGGYRLPKPIAGHPALELCNTLAGWNDRPADRNEWLPTYAHLAAWAEYSGLIDVAPDHDDAVLSEVYELRAATYQVLRCRDAGALERVAVFAEAANRMRRFGESGFVLPASTDPRQPLHAAALAVADLLSRPDRTTVRACPGEGCGWLFLDVRGRRVWCSMAACGNRAKVRAHAARRRMIS